MNQSSPHRFSPLRPAAAASSSLRVAGAPDSCRRSCPGAGAQRNSRSVSSSSLAVPKGSGRLQSRRVRSGRSLPRGSPRHLPGYQSLRCPRACAGFPGRRCKRSLPTEDTTKPQGEALPHPQGEARPAGHLRKGRRGAQPLMPDISLPQCPSFHSTDIRGSSRITFC